MAYFYQAPPPKYADPWAASAPWPLLFPPFPPLKTGGSPK